VRGPGDTAVRVTVYPPSGRGRRVRAGDRELGVARSPAELVEFLRRAGLDPDDVRLDDPGLFDWRGGGPHEWGVAEGE
jgi:hypothetical protein